MQEIAFFDQHQSGALINRLSSGQPYRLMQCHDVMLACTQTRRLWARH